MRKPKSFLTKYVKTPFLKKFDVHIYHLCRWHQWLTITLQYIREFFEKNLKFLLSDIQGLGGNWFVKETQSRLPLKKQT